MRAFGVDRELGSANVISWNHQEFEVCAQWEYVSGYVCDALEARWVYHIEIQHKIWVFLFLFAGEIRVPFG